jgi:hypothetical protein
MSRTILKSKRPSATAAFNSVGVADSAIASACQEPFAGTGSDALAGEIPRLEKTKVAEIREINNFGRHELVVGEVNIFCNAAFLSTSLVYPTKIQAKPRKTCSYQ